MSKAPRCVANSRCSSESNPVCRNLGWVALCLGLGLAALFSRSFSPSAVLFANDAPLGVLRSQEAQAWSNYQGAWQDLNWLGAAQITSLPDFSHGFYLLAGALGYAKFYAPFSLLLLGLSACFFLSRLGMSRLTSVLGGVATALTTDPFSYACWGLPSTVVCMAAIFMALGILAPGLGFQPWARIALAGLFVGLSLTEGYDNGAILSLYVASFVIFQAWLENGSTGRRL